MTSNKSGWWTTQGYKDGGNNGGGDVVMMAVSFAGIGRCDESRRGEEEDAVMAVDRYRQQSTKIGDGNGGCNGDSKDDGDGDGDSNSDDNGNSTTATATTINNKQQQKKQRRLRRRRRWRKWRRWRRKLWWQRWQLLLAPVKGRGDHCSNHRCQVSAAATTISADSTGTPWLKYNFI
jgi:hypothetical protein